MNVHYFPNAPSTQAQKAIFLPICKRTQVQGVPIKIKKGRGSGSFFLLGGLDKTRHIVPPPF